MQMFQALAFLSGTLPAVFLSLGLYFTLSTRFINLRGFPDALRVISAPYKGEGISPRRGLLVSLGAVMGPGNLLGVAAAVAYGGPGAVFWMWFSGIIGMALRFAETSLAALSRQKGGQGYGLIGFLRGIGKHRTAAFFALTGVLVSLVMADLTSAASFLAPAADLLPFSPFFIALILSLCALPVVCGGGKKVLAFAPWVVAFLSAVYLLTGLFILFSAPSDALFALSSIMKGAFNFRPAAIGVTLQAVRQGIAKGVYSNECGLGSEPMISGELMLPSPGLQGKVSMLSPFLDTVVFGGLSGILCVMSGNTSPEGMLSSLYERFFPGFGEELFLLLLGLLVYATLISWYFCGEGFWTALTGGRWIWLYRFLYLLTPLPASLFPLEEIYLFCDGAVALMAMPGLYTLWSGRKEVIRAAECGSRRPH